MILSTYTVPVYCPENDGIRHSNLVVSEEIVQDTENVPLAFAGIVVYGPDEPLISVRIADPFKLDTMSAVNVAVLP